MLQVFNCLDAEELYDEAMNNAETDDDRASYWDSPSWNLSAIIITHLNDLSTLFCKILRKTGIVLCMLFEIISHHSYSEQCCHCSEQYS